MPEPEKLESVPPVRVISDSTKLVDDSERVKVIAAVSPAFREATSEEMAMVGRVVSGVGEGEGVVVSTERVTVLLASDSSWLLLSAASENLSLATWMTPLAVLFVVGVKVAE